MKNLKYLLIVFMLVVFIISCKKDKEDEFDYPYSELSPEQNKSNVEQTGVDLVGQMSDLESSNAFKVLMQLDNLMGESSSYSAARIISPLSTASSLKNSENPTMAIFKSLKSTNEDPNSITEAWEEISARYVWNFDTQEFDSLASADALVFEFPGIETDVTNTAIITVNKPGVIIITTPMEGWPEDMDPEVPVSFSANLSYNGSVIVAFDFTASYTNDGLPVSVTSSLTIEDFVFTAAATHSPYTNASLTYNLKRQGEIIFEIFFKADGNWSEENIQNATDEYSEEVYVEQILKSSNAHLILLNLKLAGRINLEGMATKMRALDEQYWGDDLLTPTEQENYANDMVKAVNDNADLVLLYTDTEKMIAKAEAYTYYDEYWEEYTPDVRFIFSDGSPVDGETYLNEELGAFFDALNDFINDLNAEYDLEIEPVNP